MKEEKPNTKLKPPKFWLISDDSPIETVDLEEYLKTKNKNQNEKKRKRKSR
jgi:hypothetical protein